MNSNGVAKEFGALSTTDEVLAGVDLTGVRVLITGVSAGLGLETARAVMARGAEVVGTARDPDKARDAVAAAFPSGWPAQLSLEIMDLASLDSVRACADRLQNAGKKFDVVIANAGVMACPKGETVDGFETQLGTNHLGHFVFVNRIASLIGDGGRVVMVSSLAHRFADVDLDDLNWIRRPYVEFHAYGSSKTANCLFAVEFDRRHRERGVRATALHPGSINTELARHLTPEVLAQLPARPPRDDDAPATNKTIPQGAATSVWCGFVADANAIGGRYCEDCHVADVLDGDGLKHGVASYALDAERASQLWQASEAMVGETF